MTFLANFAIDEPLLIALICQHPLFGHRRCVNRNGGPAIFLVHDLFVLLLWCISIDWWVVYLWLRVCAAGWWRSLRVLDLAQSDHFPGKVLFSVDYEIKLLECLLLKDAQIDSSIGVTPFLRVAIIFFVLLKRAFDKVEWIIQVHRWVFLRITHLSTYCSFARNLCCEIVLVFLFILDLPLVPVVFSHLLRS